MARAWHSLAAVGVLAVAGCGGDAPTGNDSEQIGSVAVTAPAGPIFLGETTQLAATVRTPDGRVLPGHRVTWTSEDTTIARVAENGVISGQGVGQVVVRATTDGMSDSTTVSVVAPKVESSVYVLRSVGNVPLPFLMTDYTSPDGARHRHWIVADTLRFLADGTVPNVRVHRWADHLEPGAQEDVYEDTGSGGGYYTQLDDLVAVAWNWITPPPPTASRDSLRLRPEGLVRRVQVPAPCPACPLGPVVEFLYTRH